MPFLNDVTKNKIENKEKAQSQLSSLKNLICNRVVGQDKLVESMLICLLCDGHLLVEGMPGLAKTTAAKILSQGLEGDFHRIQFTPDLLPSDIVGTDIFNSDMNEFTFRQGPIFNNILLADEINRAPAKVQSALLEAMEEKQVTVGLETYELPELFTVIATQNPIEQEGTYNLPEAQLDRFLMHAKVGYPTREQEMAILDINESLKKDSDSLAKSQNITTQAEIFIFREVIQNVYLDPKLKSYIVSISLATRNPKSYGGDLGSWIKFGVSPRATIALLKCAKAIAWLNGDEYVSPDHILYVAPNILRHRIVPSFEAEADNISNDEIIENLLQLVAIP